MNTRTRTIIASLVSPLAMLLVPISLGVFTVYDYQINGADLMDDAPIRSVGLFFVLVPIIYPSLVIIVFLSTWLLGKIHLLSKQSLTTIVIVLSVVLGGLFGLQSPFGLKDQLIGVGVFTSLITICLGLGVIAWWLIAKPRHNNGGTELSLSSDLLELRKKLKL
jgi:hypothetical protein